MASEQMEALDNDYRDDPDAVIAGAITIVRILKKTGEDAFVMNVRKRHNIPDPVEVLGILDIAKQQVLQQLAQEQ
jgi:hypothetical protein